MQDVAAGVYFLQDVRDRIGVGRPGADQFPRLLLGLVASFAGGQVQELTGERFGDGDAEFTDRRASLRAALSPSM